MTLLQEIITGLLCLVICVALKEFISRGRRNDQCLRFGNPFKSFNPFSPFTFSSGYILFYSKLAFSFLLRVPGFVFRYRVTSNPKHPYNYQPVCQNYFVMEASPDLPSIQSNGQYPRLVQILCNLFASAIQFFLSFCKSNREKVRLTLSRTDANSAHNEPDDANSNQRFFGINPDLLLRLIWSPRILMGLFLVVSFTGKVNGATVYSTAAGGNWSNPATWVGGTVPVAGDDVTIADGATVTIDTDTPAIGNLTIGQLASGILQYEAGKARTLTVSGIVTIKSGSIFRSAPSGSTSIFTDHLLVVGGSIINNGILNFSAPAGAGGVTANASGAGITFTGAKNATFDCSAASLTNLRQTNGIVLEKGNSATSVLSFTPGKKFQVLTDGTPNAKGFLSIISGTFNIIGSNKFVNPVFNTEGSYTIPAKGGFWLGNQNATVTGMDGVVTNLGELKITNGQFIIGTPGGNSDGIQNSGQLKIFGGNTTVFGRLNMETGECIVSGGKIMLKVDRSATSEEPAFNISPAAKLTVYGDPQIVLDHPVSRQEPLDDIRILEGSGAKSITGGTFLLGTADTPVGSTFFVNSDTPFNKIAVFNECNLRIVDTSKKQFKSKLNGIFSRLDSENGGLALTAPESQTIKCNDQIPDSYASLQSFLNDGGKTSLNCTLLPATFKKLEEIRSGTTCPYTLTRTYQVTDVPVAQFTVKC
jgi:hypothetical protein